jgi:hypothetical protein
MKIFRRVCICLIATGAILLFAKSDSRFETVPFPAAGLTVKMIADVKTDGDYCLEALMPRPDQGNTLGEETVPCSLIVTLIRNGKPSITNQVPSLSLSSEFGFARIQYFEATPWHLSPGQYEVEITSRENCKAAVSRGAALSLEQKQTGITERFLIGVLRYWSGVFFLCAGLLGIIFCEFKKP